MNGGVGLAATLPLAAANGERKGGKGRKEKAKAGWAGHCYFHKFLCMIWKIIVVI